jgi:hypothetical protein
VLESLYPEPALLPPAGTDAAKRAEQLMRLERRLFGDWMQWLTSSWCALLPAMLCAAIRVATAAPPSLPAPPAA